jgi:hypothetical protein
MTTKIVKTVLSPLQIEDSLSRANASLAAGGGRCRPHGGGANPLDSKV